MFKKLEIRRVRNGMTEDAKEFDDARLLKEGVDYPDKAKLKMVR